MFDHGDVSVAGVPSSRAASLRAIAGAAGVGARAPEGIAVAEPLEGIVPGGRLRRGGVVTVPEAGYLTWALAAGASRAGGWCAVVGVEDVGLGAAIALGVDAERLLVVEEPGSAWPEVVAVLADAMDVVIVRPPSRPRPEVARRLGARLRAREDRAGAAIVMTGPFGADWEGAWLRLRVESSRWSGIGDGFGYLTGRRVHVVAEGRATGGRPRVARVWLPAPDGTIADWSAVPPPLWDTPEAPTPDVAALADAAARPPATATVA